MSTGCTHSQKYLAFCVHKNGKHLGLWCPECRRWVPDEAGHYWIAQKGDLSHVPIIGAAESPGGPAA